MTKAKNETDDILDDIENSEVYLNENSESECGSLVTSTPHKRKFKCKESTNETQCTD